MSEVVGYLVVFFASRALSYALLAWDETRMSDAQRARAWPDASRLSAIFAFSFLALPIHYVRTRRSVLGFVIGIAWTAVILVATMLAASAVDLVLPTDG